MRPYRDNEIIARVESHAEGFHGWDDGIYDVWVRAKSGPFDHFNDKVFTYKVTNGVPTFIMACTGTSVAGSFGLFKFRTYNKDGCAVLKSDQIVYGAHKYGLHKGKLPAYVENPEHPFPYYRDGDADRQAEEIGPIHHDDIGANCHRAGLFSTIIYNWSVACLVRNQLAQFMKWLNFMIAEGKPLLNTVILKEF